MATEPNAKTCEDVNGGSNGTSIVHVEATRHEVASHLIACGMPPPMAHLLAAMDEGLGQGAMARVSDDFEQLTRARPIGVETFLRAHLAALLAG